METFADFDKYQELALRTASPTSTETELAMLTSAALGLSGESGEIADHVKKIVYHGHPLDDDTRAVVLAAREAMANAARFSGADEISVYAEADGDGISVFVRDRGTGFDRAAVPPERRGLSESIEGRMTRRGGAATISSTPGEGTEVELSLPRKAS